MKSLLAVIGVYLFVILLNILVWGGLIYVAFHFAHKYW